MPGTASCIVLVFMMAMVALGTAAWAQAPDPAEAMKAADLAMYPPSFSMRVTITTERPGRVDAVMELEVAHKADVGSLMEILSPSRSKGTRFLQTEGALWMYSPRAGSRTPIRLSPRESFQGSVFSNNDMGDSTWANDYKATLDGSVTIQHPDFGSVDTWVVVGTALRRDVPYGAIRMYLRKDGLLPLRIEYDAKSGLKLKVMELSGFATVAGRMRPGRMVMSAADGTGERSTVTIADLRERHDLPGTMFNQAWLTR